MEFLLGGVLGLSVGCIILRRSDLPRWILVVFAASWIVIGMAIWSLIDPLGPLAPAVPYRALVLRLCAVVCLPIFCLFVRQKSLILGTCLPILFIAALVPHEEYNPRRVQGDPWAGYSPPQGEWTCSPAAMEVGLRSLGVDRTEEEIARASRTGENGTRQHLLVCGLEALARGEYTVSFELFPSLEELSTWAGEPEVIVETVVMAQKDTLWGDTHHAVLFLGREGDEVVLLDPNWGRVRLPLDRFLLVRRHSAVVVRKGQ